MEREFQMTVTNTPHPNLEGTNYAYCSPSDLDKFRILLPTSSINCWSGLSKRKLFLACLPDDGSLVLAISAYDGVKEGHIALNSCHRQTAPVSIGDSVSISKFVPPDDFDLKILVLDIYSSTSKSESNIDAVELGKQLGRQFVNQVMTAGQRLVIVFEGAQYDCIVSGALVQGQSADDEIERGLVTNITKFLFKLPLGSTVKVVNQQEASSRLPFRLTNDCQSFDPRLLSFGIGGLHQEYSELLRQVFSPYYYPPYQRKKMPVRRTKGALLYGAPGTGKSLLGEAIAEMFGSRGKYIRSPNLVLKGGEAEKTVRELLYDAEKDRNTYGDHSDLRVLVLDFFSFIASRGDTWDKESIEHLILRMIDPFNYKETPNNIIFIGIAEKTEFIDPFLLQWGDLDVQVEFKPPDEPGRLEILQIYVRKYIERDELASDVILENIAAATENFTGAMLCALVRDAVTVAMFWGVSGLQPARKYYKVTNGCFTQAINVLADKYIRKTNQSRCM